MGTLVQEGKAKLPNNAPERHFWHVYKESRREPNEDKWERSPFSNGEIPYNHTLTRKEWLTGYKDIKINIYVLFPYTYTSGRATTGTNGFVLTIEQGTSNVD